MKVIARGQITIGIVEDGKDAVVYYLQPSVDAVKRDSGGTLVPGSISCVAMKKIGNNEPVSAGGITVTYRTSGGGTEIMYQIPSLIILPSSLSWIEFVLYSPSSVVLDRKRVLVVSDAQHGDVAATVDEAVDALRIGKYNILRNSGFTGDFVTTTLSEDTGLIESSELFSDPFAHWAKTGTVTQKAEPESESGYSAAITDGSIRQELFYQQIAGESYVISFKAKGTRVTVSCGGVSTTKELTGAYKRYVIRYSSEGGTAFTVTGTCEITELQLERGTVASAWGRSFLDNQTDLVRFESLLYLTDAIRNASTTINGGLILSSILQLGNYVNNVMKSVTAGVSGIYNNSDDVAFWAGGTLEQAIATVARFKNDPGYRPTEAELENMAKYVTTHGGRTILNDIIMRGYVHAVGGVFKGKVEIAGGKILLNEDGSGQLANGNIQWDEYGNVYSNMAVKRSVNIITPENLPYYIERYDDYDPNYPEWPLVAHVSVTSIMNGSVFNGNFDIDEKGEIVIRKDGHIYHVNINFPNNQQTVNKNVELFINEHTVIKNNSNGIVDCVGSTHEKGIVGGETSFAIKQGTIWYFQCMFYPEWTSTIKDYISWEREKLK